MRLCLYNVVFDPDLQSPEALFSRYWHFRHLADALSDRRHDVTVVQVFRDESIATQGAVRYQTIRKPGDSEALREAEIVHFFGLIEPRSLRQAVQLTRSGEGRVTVSCHGRYRPPNILRRHQLRRALRGVAAVFFSAEAHAEAWRGSGVLDGSSRITICPEVSSPFGGIDQDIARKQLGIDGGPVFAWTGRLHPEKDPLTALDGFRRIVEAWSGAQLLMAFSSSELLPEVERYLREYPTVDDRVTLLGRIPHEQVEVLFSAADFFLQSSRSEYGSVSLVEAMSCGAIPVVTDIPSFRQLTNGIAPACLFECGDAEGMADAVLSLRPQDFPVLSEDVRKGFQRDLSYSALARVYERTFTALG